MKVRAIFLVAAIGPLGLALGSGGVQAESRASCNDQLVMDSTGSFTDTVTTNAPAIVMRLREKGVNVTSVEPWNGCVRAFVARPDGGTKMELFDPETLAPVH